MLGPRRVRGSPPSKGVSSAPTSVPEKATFTRSEPDRGPQEPLGVAHLVRGQSEGAGMSPAPSTALIR